MDRDGSNGRGGMGPVSARALARSSIYVNLARVFHVGTRLILTPIVISVLGLEGYGTWALLFTLCGSVLVIHAGFGWACAKLTAELDRTRDYAFLGEVVGSAMALVSVIGGVFLGGIWAARTALFPVLGVPAELQVDASRVLIVLGAGLLWQAGMGLAVQVLGGLQRVDLQYKIEILGSFIELGAVPPMLYAGLGLPALALGYGLRHVVCVATAWVLCRRLRPALTLSPLRASRLGLRRVASLAIRFQGLLALMLFLQQMVRLLISGLCGVATLGVFHLAGRLLEVARTPAASVVNPLMPAFASLTAGEEAYRWKELFARASKALALAAAVPLVFAAVFADSILFAWTGQSYPEAAWTVRMLAPAEFAMLLTGVATAGLRAAGTVRLEMTFGIITAVLTLVGLAVGFSFAGYSGIVLAVVAARVSGSLWFQQRFATFRNLRLRAYMRTLLVAPLSALLPIFLAVGLLGVVAPILPSAAAPRWAVLLRLLALAVGFASACALVVWTSILSAGERRAVRGLIPR